MQFISHTFPTEPGCYVDGSYGHYAEAELLCRFGNSLEEHIGAAYLKDPDGVDRERVSEAADKVVDRWNEALPEHKLVTWEDGELFIVQLDSGI